MAIIYSYPRRDPLLTDIMLAAELNFPGEDPPVTKSFTIAQLVDLIEGGGGVYAPINSPQFTGTPFLPIGTTGVTQSISSNSTALATTAFVQNILANFPSPATNLNYIQNAGYGTITSSTGQPATLPLASDTYAGLLSPAKFIVLQNTTNTNSGDNAVNSLYSPLAAQIAGKEPALGNPSTTGYVLSSNTTGVRTWIPAGAGSVTAVTATSPITSSNGTAPVISTSMSTNKLIGRSTAGTGVMEEITVGSGLTLSGGALTNTATPTALGYYGAFQDLLTQTIIAVNVGQPFLIRTVDESNQVSITANGSGQLTRITPANAGTYNIQWSGQFQNPNNSIHDVNVWFRKGLTSSSGPATDIPGSNGKIALPARKSALAGEEGHIVASWNFVLTIAAGEYVEFYWMSDNTLITLQAYPGALPPPSTASLIVTVTQQSGIMAGTGITGTGTTNYIPKFTGTTAVGNSQIFDNGTNIGVGTTIPTAKVHVKDSGSTTNSVTYFTDNYNRVSLSPGGTPSVAYSVSTSGVNISPVGANPYAISMTTGNAYNYALAIYPAFPSNNFNPVLSGNSATLQWAINTRQSQQTTLTGFGTGQAGQAFVLACNVPNPSLTTAFGYALVYGIGGATSTWSLVKFAGGLINNANITTIITGPAPPSPPDARYYYALRVTYIAATNKWSLYVVADGQSASKVWSSHLLAITLVGFATDSTYTSSSLPHFSFVYNAITSNGFFGNFTFQNILSTTFPTAVKVEDGNTSQLNGFTILQNLVALDAATDAAAALLDVPLYGVYRTGNILKVRTT